MTRKKLKYQLVANELKAKIQQEIYKVGDLLPSENNLCDKYQITRTTARKALDELMKEGYIIRQHGKGSVVIERRKTLGLLTLKGFSDAVEEKVDTIFTQKPSVGPWPENYPFTISENELCEACISFERIRSVSHVPVMLERNWFSGKVLQGIEHTPFIAGSFFKTLSQKYGIEITGSQQEIKATLANDLINQTLHIPTNNPIVQVDIKFSTSHVAFNVYAQLFCNTALYPIGNNYQPF